MKIHLGCGKRYIPGFVHVDRDRHPHVDHVHDLKTLPFFDSGIADVIYSCHVFEYFDRFEAKAVLKEWRRVLKPGGTLRLAVPDFEALTEVYRRGYGLDRVLGPLFGRIEINEGNTAKTVLFHKTTYDFQALKALLEENGFEKARRYDWRETIHKDHDDFSQAYVPHMDKEKGVLISLNVEATKSVD